MAVAPSLPEAPSRPKADVLQQAFLILKYAHDTSASLLKAFNAARLAKKGTPSDEEQDLLRAMVVFAGAGLDSMTKQIVRDALPVMIENLPERRKELEKFVVRHLRRSVSGIADDLGDDGAMNPERLVKLLLADSPRAGVAEMLVDDLTAGSLQSAGELFRVVAYLGVDSRSLSVTEKDLRDVFECRNQIIHELDIDFSRPNRNRFSRTRADMVRRASLLLDVSAKILGHVDSSFPKAPAKAKQLR